MRTPATDPPRALHATARDDGARSTRLPTSVCGPGPNAASAWSADRCVAPSVRDRPPRATTRRCPRRDGIVLRRLARPNTPAITISQMPMTMTSTRIIRRRAVDRRVRPVPASPGGARTISRRSDRAGRRRSAQRVRRSRPRRCSGTRRPPSADRAMTPRQPLNDHEGVVIELVRCTVPTLSSLPLSVPACVRRRSADLDRPGGRVVHALDDRPR